MHPDWESALQHMGASIENNVAQHFGDSRAEAQATASGNVICPLTQYALIQISGDDKTGFCQGQFTHNINLVSASKSQLSAYCSPKGRMLACFRVFQKGDDYCLRLPLELAATTMKRLRLFILRAKVRLTESDWIGLGLSGPDAEDLLADCLGQPAPAAMDATLATDTLCIIRVPGALPRFELYGGVAPILLYWEQLRRHTQPVGAAGWTLLEIRAGLPSVAETTMDAFVPQMANLDLVGGISFHKGCYVGQEIVARMHYLGRLKRRMFRLWLDTDVLPVPGAELFAPALRGEQSVGHIVNSAPSPTSGSEALAVLTLEYVTADLQLANQPGCKIEQRELPYTLPSGDA